MNLQSTYNELLSIELDIIEQSKKSPAFRHFNYEKVRRFYSANQVRLQSVKEQIKSIMDAHIKLGKDDKFLKLENGNWDFITEADGIEYHAKLDNLCNTTITIY